MNKVVLKGKIGLFSELPQKVIFYICRFLNRHDTLLLSELNHTFYRLIDNYLLYQTKLSYVELKSNKANACSDKSFGRIIAHVAKMFTFNHTKCQTAEKLFVNTKRNIHLFLGHQSFIVLIVVITRQYLGTIYAKCASTLNPCA